jgi:hypothetical protein
MPEAPHRESIPRGVLQFGHNAMRPPWFGGTGILMAQRADPELNRVLERILSKATGEIVPVIATPAQLFQACASC